eukprot:Lankesteria_metandrocarpae@DN2995_c0_g1_i1.p1
MPPSIQPRKLPRGIANPKHSIRQTPNSLDGGSQRQSFVGSGSQRPSFTSQGSMGHGNVNLTDGFNSLPPRADNSPKLDAARRLLMNSHVSTAQHTLACIRAILLKTNEDFSPTQWSSLMRDYNESQCYPLRLDEEGGAGVVCAEARVGMAWLGDSYIHPRSGKTFTVNHASQTGSFTDEPGDALNQDDSRGLHSKYRLEVERAYDVYVRNHYGSGLASRSWAVPDRIKTENVVASAVFGQEHLDGSQSLSFVMHCATYVTKTWAGAWVSKWKVSFIPGADCEDAVLEVLCTLDSFPCV